MGMKRFLKNRYNIAFVILIILYTVFLSYNLDFTLGWDESRHSCQGHIFYDYFRTILEGDYMPLSKFVSAYGDKGISPGAGYNIGWYAYFDPPVHAIFQGIVFLFMGDSVWNARFATHLLILLLSPLLYLLSSKLLKSRRVGLLATMLYLTSYMAFFFGRLSFLAVPISLCLVGWYYFFFYKKTRSFAIRISSSIKFGFQINVLVSALFLTAATLMKYQSIIYAGLFIGVYIIYLIVKDIRKRRISHVSDLFSSLKESGAWSLGWKFAFQLVILFVLSWWWIKMSLYEGGMWKRILFEGAGREREWNLNFFFEFIKQTFMKTSLLSFLSGAKTSAGGVSVVGIDYIKILASTAWFALVPIGIWFMKRKESFITKNPRLLIYIGTVYVSATLLMSNRQLRYMIHALPFLFILIARGIEDVSEFLKRKFKIRYAFYMISIILIGICVYADINITKSDTQSFGVYSPELVEYIEKIDNPKMLLNIKGKVEPSETGYYYTPDLFIFETMMANDQHNPFRMMQSSSFIEWVSIQNDYENILEQITSMDNQIDIIIILFKYDAGDIIMVEPVRNNLKKAGYKETELKWYLVFEKE